MSEAVTTAQQATPSYEVQLEVFSGPLELLLHLVRKGDLDITVVSLAKVTDQFLAYVTSRPELDADQTAEFLVVAAKLLLIKALALIARPVEQPPEEEEEGEDLVRALKQFELFQRAAAQFKAWEAEPRKTFARSFPVAPIRRPAPDGLTPADLLAALRSGLATPMSLPELPIPAERVYTIEDKICLIRTALLLAPAVAFVDLLPPLAPSVEVIVTFLALLQLLKDRAVMVEQRSPFGEIRIVPGLLAEAAPDGG